MTITGADISSYQHGTDVAALVGEFVILKCTEGVYYVDPDYTGWAPLARAAGKTVIAYHFLKVESSPQAQAVYLAAHIGDHSLPVMLDVETEGASKPDIGFVLQTIDTMRQRGLNVRLVYLPHWYWQEIGSPSLVGLADRGVGLVASNYPGGDGYPGDTGAGWEPYGGIRPLLWQYTSSPIDMNAYRGTIDELRTFLEGTDVNLTDTVTITGGFAARYPATGPDGFTAGAAVPVATLLEGAAIRAVNNEHLLTQILAKVSGPGAVNVKALAAEIVTELAPHLGASDPTVVAEAVRARLEAALSA